MVEQGGVATRQRPSREFLDLLWVLLYVRQLETAAKQQVQELGLQDREWTQRTQQLHQPESKVSSDSD